MIKEIFKGIYYSLKLYCIGSYLFFGFYFILDGIAYKEYCDNRDTTVQTTTKGEFSQWEALKYLEQVLGEAMLDFNDEIAKLNLKISAFKFAFAPIFMTHKLLPRDTKKVLVTIFCICFLEDIKFL